MGVKKLATAVKLPPIIQMSDSFKYKRRINSLIFLFNYCPHKNQFFSMSKSFRLIYSTPTYHQIKKNIFQFLDDPCSMYITNSETKILELFAYESIRRKTTESLYHNAKFWLHKRKTLNVQKHKLQIKIFHKSLLFLAEHNLALNGKYSTNRTSRKIQKFIFQHWGNEFG